MTTTFITQFSLSDEIFFIFEGKIRSSKINQIDINQHERNSQPQIRYFVNVGDDKNYKCEIIPEGNAFPSRETLIESL